MGRLAYSHQWLPGGILVLGSESSEPEEGSILMQRARWSVQLQLGCGKGVCVTRTVAASQVVTSEWAGQEEQQENGGCGRGRGWPGHRRES